MKNTYRLGLDIGSTTIKAVLLDERGTHVTESYKRHFSDTRSTLKELLAETYGQFPGALVSAQVTGSGGMGLAGLLGIPFVQEVIASTEAVQRLLPGCTVAIELGGEDAKITSFDGTVEQRMNGICAGGTGSFIDQMASLMNTDATGLNALAERSTTIYQIASRCGVFAKSDVQSLLNEGASREDIAASVFQSVVNQTISGLACGKPIRGRVALLGGHIDALDVSPAEVGQHVLGGKLKMLGIMADERIPAFGSVPTFKERKLDLALGTWRGLAAPKGTPKAVIDLQREVARKTSADTAFKEGLAKLNLGQAYLDAPQFAQAMQRDHEYFGQLIQKNGIKV